jgi:hypothetical protein
MRALALCVLATIFCSAAHAADVDLILALVSDVSRSIDDSEFTMQKEGIQAAFSSPHVLAAIQGGPVGAIAVAYFEFAGAGEARTIIDWKIVRDDASARAFAAAVATAPRSAYGRTSISAGIDLAVASINALTLSAPRRVIDIAGDGTNNSGRDAMQARDDALANGMVINGLAIINDRPASWSFAHVQPPGGLDNWYRANVTGGDGSFVIAIHDFHDFADALTRKLATEIASLP